MTTAPSGGASFGAKALGASQPAPNNSLFGNSANAQPKPAGASDPATGGLFKNLTPGGGPAASNPPPANSGGGGFFSQPNKPPGDSKSSLFVTPGGSNPAAASSGASKPLGGLFDQSKTNAPNSGAPLHKPDENKPISFMSIAANASKPAD